MTRSIVVVTAGLSQPSSTRMLADRLADAAAGRLRSAGQDVTVTYVELREIAHDLTDHLLTGFPSPRLADVLARVAAADGLVAVTPVFGASYSGLFKTFFDVLEDETLAGKPVLVAATGGRARYSLAIDYAVRPLSHTFERSSLRLRSSRPPRTSAPAEGVHRCPDASTAP